MQHSKKKHRNKTNEIYFHEWVQQVRSQLIVGEEKNIRIRLSALDLLINKETTKVNKQIFGNINDNDNEFKYNTNDTKIRQYLLYIYEWKGLILRRCQNLPKTKKEYSKRARNWLNGRRSKIYGESLFYDMIQQSIEFARTAAIKSVPNQGSADHELYYKALVSAYLAKICSVHVFLDKSSRGSYLITEHAIATKTKTQAILQENMNNISDPSFPTHRRQATDYFKKQFERTIHCIHVKLNGTMNVDHKIKHIHVDNEMINGILNGNIPQIEANINKVYMDIKAFTKMMDIIEKLNKDNIKSKQTISTLQNTLEILEMNQKSNNYMNEIKTDKAAPPNTNDEDYAMNHLIDEYDFNDSGMDICMPPSFVYDDYDYDQFSSAGVI